VFLFPVPILSDWFPHRSSRPSTFVEGLSRHFLSFAFNAITFPSSNFLRSESTIWVADHNFILFPVIGLLFLTSLSNPIAIGWFARWVHSFIALLWLTSLSAPIVTILFLTLFAFLPLFCFTAPILTVLLTYFPFHLSIIVILLLLVLPFVVTIHFSSSDLLFSLPTRKLNLHKVSFSAVPLLMRLRVPST
jgi:hypothetical protein